MKVSKLITLLAALLAIGAFNGAALAAAPAHHGKVVAQVTGGGYLENGYKCGIAVVKKEVRNSEPVLEGTLHCMSVTAKGKFGDPLKLLIDCDPVDLIPNCTISSSHAVASASIICKGGKQVDVTSGVEGSPTENGTIATNGWVGSDFSATPVLHGTVNVQCK